MNATQVTTTYRDALTGNLRAIIQWDEWRLADKQRALAEFPNPRLKRSIAYLKRKLASMRAELEAK